MDEIIRHIPEEILAEVRKIREDIHRHPELAFHEHRTADAVIASLARSGVEIVARGVAGTGVVGKLAGEEPGSCVALRADMDALPIDEKTGLDYASRTPGVMHACGHDGHTAVLLGTARLLSGLREKFGGTVKFIFQPGEEKGNGADRMVQAGVLSDAPAVDAIFALHARPQIEAGQIELDPIPSAATNAFKIRVKGKGTHAAYPHLGIDPVAIGSQIVCALQQVAARQVAPYQAAVVTVGSFQAGAQGNIIPSEAVLRGTIRTRDPEVRTKAIESVRTIATGVAGALGAGCEVEIESGTPRVRNDERLNDLVRRVGERILGAENVLDAVDVTMGGEDFSFYLSEQGGVPGCLFRLGVETDQSIHTPGFDFGTAALEPGILMMANVALTYLSEKR
jgi:amidohydrolase